ncbi:hypothetical protein [Salinibacter ruber]|uniref:hypothetical protein n=1 Tax=Salinibacter ruber TaxID=146919 RepID=UPI00216A14AD|nr:hypothetical protein [Salinibacter ruber]MCS4049521.1 hypothetical protein [Salinibacter ruber]
MHFVGPGVAPCLRNAPSGGDAALGERLGLDQTVLDESGKGERPRLECGRAPLREPLDGKTLLDVKQEADEHLWDCTSVLTQATAVLEEDTIRRAQELVDALLDARETLEAQEASGEASSEAVRGCVSALHEARAQFLRTARTRLGLDALSEETDDRIAALTQQASSPSSLPRPYVAAGVRLPEERR